MGTARTIYVVWSQSEDGIVTPLRAFANKAEAMAYSWDHANQEYRVWGDELLFDDSDPSKEP